MTDRTSPTSPAGAPAAPGPRPVVRLVDVVGLAVLTVVLRVPAYLSSRHLTFDDGVFASSAVAMREGGVPFRDVFSSQGPLFLPLVYLGDLLGLRTLDSTRVLAVVSGVACVLLLYWAATRLTDRTGALLAGVLAATSGSLLWVTGPLAADGPALAFACWAFALALVHRDRPRLRTALLLGVAVGACLSTKAMEAPILVPVGLVLLAPLAGRARRRRLDATALGHATAAAVSALAVFLLVSLPFGFSDVWDQSVRYRADAAAEHDLLANAGKLVSTLWDRDLVLLLFCAIALGAGQWRRIRGGTVPSNPVPSNPVPSNPVPSNPVPSNPVPSNPVAPSNSVLVWSWAVVSTLWLVVVVSPLWRPHVSAMVPPLVLLVALHRPPVRAIAVGAVISLPLLVVQLDGLLAPGDYTGSEAEVVAAIRELPEGAWVLSDEPGLVWRAGRRTTDDLVDPSMLRVQQGRYTEESLAEAAADPRVCAVVVRSEQRFGSFPGLGDRLAAEGYEVSSDFGDGRVVYTRSACAPEA